MKYVFIWMCFASTLLFAQENTADKKPTIDVIGTAKMQVVPDEIYIAITLKERTDRGNKQTVGMQEEELKKALTLIKVPIDQLTLSAANADYIHVSFKKKEVVERTNYSLKVKDAKTAASVFEKLDSLNVENAYISHVDHSQIEELRKQVRVNAIKAAKEKADYLLEAIDEKRGPAILVEEQANEVVGIYANRQMIARDYIEQGSIDKIQNIQFKKITLEATIHVIFEIKN